MVVVLVNTMNAPMNPEKSTALLAASTGVAAINTNRTGWRSACTCAVGVGEMFKAFVRASFWLY